MEKYINAKISIHIMQYIVKKIGERFSDLEETFKKNYSQFWKYFLFLQKTFGEELIRNNRNWSLQHSSLNA